MKITITGSSGFAGKNLVSYLKEFNIQKLSLRYKASQEIYLQSTNAVIHLSGKAHDLKKVSQPQDYYDANFELTKQLYNAFLHSDAKKFIFVSSVKATADSLNEPLKENHKSNPQTHYGKSKLQAEQYIQNQLLPNDKSYYILRPCMIHGPGNKGNLNLLYNFVSKGLPYPLAGFNNERSFLSVENICFVIKEILNRDDIPSGLYNIADDEALSTTEVVRLLSSSLNKQANLLKIPACFIKGLARLGDVLHLPLNTERLQKLTESYIVDNTKIKQVLKKDLPLSAREGILRTARSFKNA